MTILLTNDDGIRSPGLWAAAEKLSLIAELWVVAPEKQCSSAGRSHSRDATGKVTVRESQVDGAKCFAVDCSPAQCIHHALLNIMPKKPDLIVSGINSGVNVSIDVTRSGTVGAALEAANYGIPAMAVSLETTEEDIFSDEPKADFSIAADFCRKLAPAFRDLGADVHVLKVEVPAGASTFTEWELTSLSRLPYYLVMKSDSSDDNHHNGLSWQTQNDFSVFKEGTDAHTVFVKKKVAVTPLSLDLTSRVSLDEIQEKIETDLTD